MNNILLSICIPVYNFGAFIGKTLESIISQASDAVEIVVVDGASTDNTIDVIKTYQKRFPRLRYHRLEKRGGIDRDMAKTVELAAGNYCWLFSGDDIMRPGAISRALNELSSEIDLLLCESMLCGFDMHPVTKHKMLDIDAKQVFDLGNKNDRLRYFRLARNTGAFFSFCGALIFKKDVWNLVAFNEAFAGSCWAHAARFFEIIPRGLKVKYLPDPFLDKRGDNDSFLDKGIVNRYKLGIDGYHRLADAFFGHDSIEAFHIRRVVQHEFPPHVLLHAKLECHDNNLHEDRLVLDRLAYQAYSDPVIISRIYLYIYKLTPLLFYRILKSIRAMFK
ncbi:MAG: glycosyltransferase family 2 protein [Nitrospirae bacterium]|nr:glycosyltransferase family 2 protein [Nitrospirota bacterium]